MSNTRMTIDEPSSAPRMTAWGPLAQPAFRALWLAALVSNMGTLMQGVGAAWLMTSLTSTAVLVALLQTAGSLPILLVGLPAGALADVIDRRKLIVYTQVWMLAVATLLGTLTLFDLMTPWLLLTLTFLIGLGGALSAPAWQAIIPQLVGRQQLPAAVALNSAGFNLARAIGPALGGVIVAAIGPWAVFLINAASFVAVIVVMLRWKTEPVEATAPTEGIFTAIRAGMRYTRHAPALQAVLTRTIVFILPASALWALLPLVARQDLGLGATGYGVMLGSIGFGAVGGAALLPRIRERLTLNRQMVAFSVVFATSLLVLGTIHNVIIGNLALIATGIGWITLTSSLNVSAQLTTPPWVQARALGIYLLVFQGGFAVGSALWGAVAEAFGNARALSAAAALLVASILTARRWYLRSGDELDLNPSAHWEMPDLEWEPNGDDGPVLVSVEYHVTDAKAASFGELMQEMRVLRLRDGASRWGLFRDPVVPDRYLETFVVSSWAEHMRQHERATRGDKAIEDAVIALQKPGTAPVVSHFISVSSATTAP